MTSPDGINGPLTSDLAVEYERAFMRRLSKRMEEAERFRIKSSDEWIKGSARREDDLTRDFRQEVDRILRSANVFDPVISERLPKGLRAVWSIRSGNILSRRTVLTVTAAVVHPYRDLALGLRPSPLGPEEALRWLSSESSAEGGSLGVVLSTSGWREGGGDASLILFEPARGGGFMVRGRSAVELPGFLALASEEELEQRVLDYVESERVMLVLDGLELRNAGAALGVPETIVRRAFVRAATEGEFLRVVEEDGTLVLRRA